MANKIITIGRQFGSGGRELGRRLAEALQIAYYDKEILTEHWLTPLQIPVGMLQLVLIQIREQAPVVIE